MLSVGLYGIPDVSGPAGPQFTHDHGVVFVRDGRVLTAVQLERYTGVKHDNRLPQFICEILDRFVPPGEEVRFVSVNHFLGDSFISSDGRLRIEPQHRPELPNILTPARCTWYPAGGRRRTAQAYVICHEFAHLAACLPFCGSFAPGSLLVHIDGGASRSACSFWHMDGQTPRCLHHGWNDLKDAVNHFNASPLARAILGLRPEDHLAMPGKLMGYAGLGRCPEAWAAALTPERWFVAFAGDGPELLARVNRVLGTAIPGWDLRDRSVMNLAAGLQQIFEQQLSSAILGFARRIGARTLYYAGGAALNIATNRLLEESGLFQAVHIPPAANDSGLALGAAAYLEHLDHGPLPRHSPFLNAFGAPDACDTGPIEEMARLLAAGKVLGLCQGAGEIGPRALGHRSILARPDSVPLRRRVSEQIKGREWYRPVAPVVCDDVAREIWGEQALRSPLLRFMLSARQVPAAWQDRFAGLVHADGSVRVQVIGREDLDNALLYQLLRQLWQEHGVPGLINTSYNRAGHPLVQRPQEALEAAEVLGLDGVSFGGASAAQKRTGGER